MQPRRNFQRSRHRGRPYSQTMSFTPKKHLDINCNIGQGFGIHQDLFEEKVIPYVTSVNVACGFHAGDPLTMSKVIEMARNQMVSIGALIGYGDLLGNGQREMYLEVDELRAMVLYQLGAIHALLHSKGLEVRHARTHGFLYKQMYSDLLVAETVAKAIAEFSKWITLVGLSGHILQTACTNANIKAGQEVIINRRYRKDGTILPYSEIIDGKNFIENSTKRANELIQTGFITCEDKSRIRVHVDTIHVPSDTKDSIELARSVRSLVADPKPLHMDKHEKYLAAMTVLD